MLNALNALSDEGSLLTVGFFANPTLILAMMMSIALHCMICYVPFFEGIFGTVELTKNDWILVMMASVPVIFLDEILKIGARFRTRRALEKRRRASKN
mmetsp:Transcript_139387/g.197326  ORF Transcript_139387/g.197326 Transcript_139387/m.197326 type:complete len:98 (-) Transcript_139387:6-299(-)